MQFINFVGVIAGEIIIENKIFWLDAISLQVLEPAEYCTQGDIELTVCKTRECFRYQYIGKFGRFGRRWNLLYADTLATPLSKCNEIFLQITGFLRVEPTCWVKRVWVWEDLGVTVHHP